jgi:hypothetical protein
MDVRHVVQELSKHASEPRWWKNRFQRRVIHPLQAKVYPTYAGSTAVMAEEWDNLIVLDGCRADLFRKTVQLERFNEYRTVTSLGSGSEEWTRKNFVDTRFGGVRPGFGDTVYVTSNPYTTRVAGESFYDLVEVHATDFDDDIGQVRPGPVADATKKAHREYPNKRLIAHFMQPHAPFFVSNWLSAEPNEEWNLFRAGHLSRDEMWRAYRETLEHVMEYVKPLVEELDGRTVVTADHGNAFGEWAIPFPIRLYCHPNGLR